MIILGIESTCDETACALVKDGKEILSNVVFSQEDLHEKYGGVFPELACRRHLDVIIPVLEEAFAKAGLSFQDVDGIAVAYGPGLIGALLIGLNVAKTLSFAWKVPFVGVNHVEAHLYAAMMPLENPPLPAVGLVVSGGHTFLVKIDHLGDYELIGTTCDDAIGECFDKVATMLGLGYPGGPKVEALAKKGMPGKFAFKPGAVKGSPWDFSFSGLKTNVLYAVKGQNKDIKAPSILSDQEKADVAYAFQETALGSVVSKTLLACKEWGLDTIYVGGGVSNNTRLKSMFAEKMTGQKLYFPPPSLSLDNAAMIAGLGFHLLQKKPEGDPFSLSPMTRIPLALKS